MHVRSPFLGQLHHSNTLYARVSTNLQLPTHLQIEALAAASWELDDIDNGVTTGHAGVRDR